MIAVPLVLRDSRDISYDYIRFYIFWESGQREKKELQVGLGVPSELQSTQDDKKDR